MIYVTFHVFTIIVALNEVIYKPKGWKIVMSVMVCSKGSTFGPKVALEVNTMFYLKGDLTEVEDGGGTTEEKYSVILDWINSMSPKTWLLFVEYVHDGGWDEFHDRVHDALFLLVVATAGWHRLLWTGEAALRGLLHRSRCLCFLLLFLLDAVLVGQMKK